jgi:miniconductance mechanosensitive channel
MLISDFQAWLAQNPTNSVFVFFLLALAAFVFARFVIARGLTYVAARTASKWDDTLIKHLRPYRVAWLAPLAVIYLLNYLIPDQSTLIRRAALFFILWLSVLTVNSLMNAVNEIYENSKNFHGISIQGYFDIAKIALVVVAVILSVSLFSGESPIVLLTGLGAMTAVLLLIFQNTILSLVASIQIAAQDLIKEGDWIEVPSYDADGDVVNISLHTIKIRNFDMTYSIIPTYKIVDVAFRNWRGMKESGGRRIQRSLLIDMLSVKFCDDEMLRRLKKIDLIHDYLETRIQAIQDYHQGEAEKADSPLDGPQITNTEIFRAYIIDYLKCREDIYHEKLPFLVRTLAPTPAGLPVELYIFTRTTLWEEYEGIQSEIIDHLLAAAGHFDLRVFQEPTGMDFAGYFRQARPMPAD